jgi:hypothetical protein
VTHGSLGSPGGSPSPAPPSEKRIRVYQSSGLSGGMGRRLFAIPYNPDHSYATVNEPRAKTIADWYERASPDAAALLDAVKAHTDEVLNVEGSKGGYILAPKAAVEKAQAELQAKGIDPFADAKAAQEARVAKREERSRQAESRVNRIDEEADNAESVAANPGSEVPTAFLPGKKFVEEDVKPKIKAVAEGVAKAWEGLKSITAPFTRSGQASTAKDILRERGSELQQRFDRLGAAFHDAKKLMDGMSTADTRQFASLADMTSQSARPL